MASLIKAGGKGDSEQRPVELDEKRSQHQRIEVGEGGSPQNLIEVCAFEMPRTSQHTLQIADMASLIKAGEKGDSEQRPVKLDGNPPQLQQMEVGKGGSPQNLIEAYSFKIRRNFAVSLVIASIALMFFMIIGLKDFQTPVTITIFLVGDIAALFVSILVLMAIVIVIRCGQALHRKRIMSISKVLLCIALGFFMVSLLAATIVVVPPQMQWFTESVGLGILLFIYYVAYRPWAPPYP